MKLEDILREKFTAEENDKAALTKIDALQSNIFMSLGEKKAKRNSKRFHSLFIPAISFAVVAGIIGVTVAQFASPKKPAQIAKHPTIAPTKSVAKKDVKKTISPTVAPRNDEKPSVTLSSGFGFSLPESWSAKISDQSKEHFAGRFFIPGTNNNLSYVEIESISASNQTSNPFIEVQHKKEERINGQKAMIITGKESFKNSNRLIKQVVFTSQNKILTMTLYKNPGDNLDSEFDQLVQSVQSDQKTAWWKPFFIKVAHAAEAIAGFDKEEYQRIEVMADPFTAHISVHDSKYKDGYAKLYTFDAFKGQRLTTVAQEDSNTGSFIKSDLYYESGQMLSSLDTRIEFEAPYTGTYYLIVHTFNKQEGSARLKIFDRNQTENLTYLKYSDGREVLIDYNKRPPQYGAEDAALIMQFISPVELENDSVKFRAKPREFESDPGQVTVPIRLYAKPGSYQEDILNGTHLPEDNQDNLRKIKITKLSPSKVVIEPSSGELFPKNYHYHLMLYLPVSGDAQSYGGGRFFLENSSQ